MLGIVNLRPAGLTSTLHSFLRVFDDDSFTGSF